MSTGPSATVAHCRPLLPLPDRVGPTLRSLALSVLAEPLSPPVLRLMPAPSADPPYDDEPPTERLARTAAVPDTQGTLALRFVLPSGLSAVPDPAPQRLVDGTVRDEDEDRLFDRQPTATHDLPEPRAWCTRLAQAAIEVLGGARPVTQLRRWTSDDVYEQLRRGVRRRSARVAEPSRRPDRPPRVVVRAVRVCEVADGTVEACAVVDDGRRARALVLRIEGADGRWRCTRLARV